MSVQIPLRVKIEQNGTVKGYVETLNFGNHSVSVNGPVADIDSDRGLLWADLGVVVQSSAPPSGITYAQWLAGGDGFWGWIEIP